MTTLIERPSSSYISISDIGVQKREGRISAKKLQQVQNWINEQIIKKNHYLNNVSIKYNIYFIFLFKVFCLTHFSLIKTY
jgi:hypothetical protein